MNRPSIRARVAIGSAIIAAAVVLAAGSLAATTEPPPSAPPVPEAPASSSPAGSAPALDPAREALVDQLVATGETIDFPVDRDCIAGLVAQLPDADVAVVAADLAAASEAISAVAPIPATVPDTDAAAETDPPATTMADPASDSLPTMSPAAEALGAQVITCVRGDADPALVAQVLTLFETDEASAQFDMACVGNLLSTFEDETLQQVIDLAAAEAADTDTAAVTMPSDVAMEDALSLLVCSPEFVAGTDTAATDAGTGVTETTAA